MADAAYGLWPLVARLATTGPYPRVQHPQYDGFLLVMIGFLLQ